MPPPACRLVGSAQDIVAVDASGLYVACHRDATGDAANDDVYEVRKYSPTGALLKILGTSPREGYGFIGQLRLTSAYAFWLGTNGDRRAIYRAEK